MQNRQQTRSKLTNLRKCEFQTQNIIELSVTDRIQKMSSTVFNQNSMHHYKSNFSTTSTDLDSASDREEEFVAKINPLKHKTELCKTYSLLGYCNYDSKCRFAHGKKELRMDNACKDHKNRRCNGFWRRGTCCYGIRCQFGHAELSWENVATLIGLQTLSQVQGRSKLLAILQ